jgi:23S rRNA-/tRNA-specific pseudouridylate synthase
MLHALEKPARIASHPNNTVSSSSKAATCSLFSKEVTYDLNEEVYSIPDDTGKQNQHVWLLNRIDAPTSGLVLTTTCSAERATAVKAAFAGRSTVKKTYFAIAFTDRNDLRSGHSQTMEDRVCIASNNSHVRLRSSKRKSSREGEGKPVTAKTVLKVEKIVHLNKDMTVVLLRLNPVTGYTHQLRYQCARRGMPLINDKTYGDFKLNAKFREYCHDRRLFAKLKGNIEETPVHDDRICRTSDKVSGCFEYVSPEERLYLHSHIIDVRYQYQGKECRFQASSGLLPGEFVHVLRDVRGLEI